MKFSIVLPVYNVEEYIRKCLDSIISQNFTDYEIIVVDDESPDNSMQIVEEFANAYPERFHIMRQKNKGNGGARNVGAAAATGEYILFVDSDDYLSAGALAAICDRLDQTPCDILMFNYVAVTPEGKLTTKHRCIAQDDVCRTAEQKSQLLQSPPHPWNKVFRREFYVDCGVMLPERTLYEDTILRVPIAKADTIVLCTDYFYNYVLRPGSIMRSKVSPRMLDIIKMSEMVRDRFTADGLNKEYKTAIDSAQAAAAFSIAELVYQQAPDDPIQKEIVAYILKTFPDYAQSPYIAPHIKKEMTYFMRKQYAQYKLSKQIYQFKVYLYQNPIVRALNEWRKKIVR